MHAVTHPIVDALDHHDGIVDERAIEAIEIGCSMGAEVVPGRRAASTIASQMSSADRISSRHWRKYRPRRSGTSSPAASRTKSSPSCLNRWRRPFGMATTNGSIS